MVGVQSRAETRNIRRTKQRLRNLGEGDNKLREKTRTSSLLLQGKRSLVRKVSSRKLVLYVFCVYSYCLRVWQASSAKFPQGHTQHVVLEQQSPDCNKVKAKEKFFLKVGREGALIPVEFFLHYNTTSFEFAFVVSMFLLREQQAILLISGIHLSLKANIVEWSVQDTFHKNFRIQYFRILFIKYIY